MLLGFSIELRKTPMSVTAKYRCTQSWLVAGFFLTVPIHAKDKQIDRRGFFTKIRDSYLQGRLEAATRKEEKRIIERKQAEKMRRRVIFERNVKTLVGGLSKRLKRGPSYIKVAVIGGVILVVWLCHKGSVGCEHDDETNSFHLLHPF